MTEETPHHEKLEWCENCHANVEPMMSGECPLCGANMGGLLG